MAKWGEIKCPRCSAPPMSLWESMGRSLEEGDAREARLEARIAELEAKLSKCEARFMKALALADEECPYRHGSNGYWDWWYKRGVSIEKLMEGTEDELG